ncbi:GH12 family glycosyl hydrolase domain-containing protein [Mycobacterium simiae]|uniref:GH12 family glycosyl hydrolase domain-containing protein n=1 Tax=Mycobacterium simiae TaxID=1784 RepID=UPI00358EEA18
MEQQTGPNRNTLRSDSRVLQQRANNLISYVAPAPISTWDFSVLDFTNDVGSRGLITTAWYLTSIQAGFEPWNRRGPGAELVLGERQPRLRRTGHCR